MLHIQFFLFFCILGYVNSIRDGKRDLKTIVCGPSNLSDQANISNTVAHSKLIDRIDTIEDELNSLRTTLDAIQKQLNSLQAQQDSLNSAKQDLQPQSQIQPITNQSTQGNQSSPSSGSNSMSASCSAVGLGYSVTYDSKYNGEHGNYRLDSPSGGFDPKAWTAGAWCSVNGNGQGPWIQVSSVVPKYWTGISTQGRGDDNWGKEYVKKYTVQYTLDGNNWLDVDEGRLFNGNTDINTKVHQDFLNSVYAITVRILPQTWNSAACMRFDAYFIC